MRYTATWEVQLQAKAFEGLQVAIPFEPLDVASPQLKAAYKYCKAITYQHSRTFYVASSLLPRSQRRAMRALYAFCRVSDDIVDTATGDARPTLRAWAQRAFAADPPTYDAVALAWADTRTRYKIPRCYGEQLLEGVARDIKHSVYESFEDLADYCYGVASTVGLMAMHITGFDGERAIPYAIKLGVALQLTNILRDVGEDLRMGRCYLPLQELQRFDLTHADVARQKVDDRWRRFMQFQIERTRRLYEESLPGIDMLHPKGRFAVAAAAELYRAILNDIEANDYNNFSYRAHLNKRSKLQRLPGIYLRSRTGGYHKLVGDSAEKPVIIAHPCE